MKVLASFCSFSKSYNKQKKLQQTKAARGINLLDNWRAFESE